MRSTANRGANRACYFSGSVQQGAVQKTLEPHATTIWSIGCIYDLHKWLWVFVSHFCILFSASLQELIVSQLLRCQLSAVVVQHLFRLQLKSGHGICKARAAEGILSRDACQFGSSDDCSCSHEQ